jgi:hypothetical protein
MPALVVPPCIAELNGDSDPELDPEPDLMIMGFTLILIFDPKHHRK